MYSLAKFIYNSLVATNSADNLNNNETKLIEEYEKLEKQCHIYDKTHNTENDLKSDNIEESNCIKKDGIITSLESENGIINDTLCFELSAAKGLSEQLTVGSKVSFLAYKYSDDIPLKVVKIVSIKNESWEKPSNFQIEEELKGLEIQKPEYFTVQKRSILGSVVERRDSLTIVETDDTTISVDLDKAYTQFVPKIGDCVYLVCHIQSDETFVDSVGEILEVISINPSRSDTKKGIITNLNNAKQHGDIDDKYFFSFDALDANYINPELGDSVSIDVIESYRSKFVWRCLKVALLSRNTNQKQNDDNNIDNYETQLTRNKYGIVISSNNLCANFTKLKETKIISLHVTNTNTDRIVTITKTCFYSKKSDSQVTLIKPIIGTHNLINLKSNDVVEFEFQVNARYFGDSKEMFVIEFDRKYKIGRCIDISVQDESDAYFGINGNSGGSGAGSYMKKNATYTLNLWNRKGDIIPGEKTVKTPKFVYAKIKTYDVPIALKNLVLSYHANCEIDEKLDYLLKNFREPLNYDNYVSRFHNLIHLEEITYFHNIRKYDMDRAHFVPEREYLSLAVANIAESRPSLVLGDSIRIRNPWTTNADNQQYFEGIIHKVLKDRILVKFTKTFHEKYNGEDYKIEFFFSRMSLRKQHHAIEKVHRAMGSEYLFPLQIKLKSLQLDAQINDDTGELLLNGKPHKWFNETLNIVQKEAIKNVLRGETRPMPYVIFGPPGTGKTMTLVEVILQIFSKVGSSRILVGTPSNSSANLITERLVATDALLPGTFIRLVGMNAIERETIPEHILSYCGTCDIARDGTTKDELITTESGLKLRCNSSYIAQHRIIIGTCNTLGNLMQMEFPRDHFTHVIIDECGQLIEPEAMIPITLINQNTGQIILAGDPMQLEPIVLSSYAKDRDLALSFLVRLLDRFPYKKDFARFEKGYDPRLVTKLLYNYRSLPSILKLFSDLFYGGDLKPTINETNSAEIQLLNNLSDMLPNNDERTPNHGIFFIGIKGVNRQSTDSPSWFNSDEARTVFYFLLQLYKRKISHNDIGIITPYQQQVKVIRTLLNDSNIVLPKIGTVEEFQGQERHIILLSTVRSSNRLVDQDIKYSLGFVQNGKRMNVAISRPRSLLVIFGNPHLLIADPNWKKLLEYCITNKTYTGCDMPNI